MPGLSESAFANMFLYQAVHDYRLHGGDHPHIAGHAYDGARIIIPLFDLPTTDMPAVAALLGGNGWIYPVPATLAGRLSDRFTMRQDEADADYVYDAAALRDLAGARQRRQQARQFEDLGPAGIVPLDSTAGTQAALGVLLEWQADTAKTWAETDFAACSDALAHRDALGLFGFVVMMAGVPAGFVLASAISTDIAVIHFAKGKRWFNGVFPFMFRQFARTYRQFTLVNFEQDLGRPGFRQAKRSYNPLRLEPKYRLRPFIRP